MNDISIDCEAKFHGVIVRYLEKDIEKQYPKKIASKAQRLKNKNIKNASISNDELKATVHEKNKEFNVRMVLPIFEEEGYSYIHCDCLEQSIDLEESRCHHMWLAQSSCLENLKKSSAVQKKELPYWQLLQEQFKECTSSFETSKLSSKPNSTSQIYWILNPDLSLQAYLKSPYQKKSSQFGMQKLSWKNFCSDSGLWAFREDQFIASRIFSLFQDQAFHNEAILSLSLLKDLQTHPNLFLSDFKTQVKIEHSSIALKSHMDHNGISFNISLEKQDHFAIFSFPGEGLCFFNTENNTLYYSFASAHILSLYENLREHSSQAVSHQVKHHILDYFASLQIHIPTEIEVTSSFSIEESKNPRPLMYLRLHPVESGGIFIEFLVKPFTSPSYPKTYTSPGYGEQTLWDCSFKNKVLKINRNLQQEIKLNNSLAEDLGLCDSISISPFTWKLSSDEEALEFMEKIEEHSDKDRIIIEWPEDQNKKFEKIEAKESDSLNISVKKNNDWFSAYGELAIDGQKVDLQTLINAFRNNLKYIKLPHGKWLKVTELLKNRLAQIEASFDYGRIYENKDLDLCPSAIENESFLNSKIEGVNLSFNDEDFKNRFKNKELYTADTISLPNGFKGTLRSYQKTGFAWLSNLYQFGLGGILADDMGLGKTIQTITLLQKASIHGPSLILCPASVVNNWKSEIGRFSSNLEVQVFQSKDKENIDLSYKKGSVLICSYGLFLHSSTALTKISWNLMVLDEAQYIKNSQSKTSQFIRNITCKFSLALTGTPIENNLQELWSIFHTINPKLLGSWKSFKEYFIDKQEKSSENQESKHIKLQEMIKPFILRRMKKDYLPELPGKTEKTLNIYLTTKERVLYDKLRMEAIASLKSSEESEDRKESTTRIEILSYLTKLRRLVCHPSLVEADWQEQSSKELVFIETCNKLLIGKHKALIFSQFPPFLKKLQNIAKSLNAKCLYLDGTTPTKERSQLVEDFQKGDTDLFFISLRAGGTGLNLTAADFVLHMDPWWNPAVEAQATDRAHRMGQKNPVTILKFIAQATIEEKIISLHREKKNLADQILLGTDQSKKLSINDLKELLFFSEETKVT